MITSERQARELHMLRKRRNEKQKLTGPDPATPRSIADPLADEPWMLVATIHGSAALTKLVSRKMK